MRGKIQRSMARRAVILAGGSGTRFWPLSRKERPKQLLSLYGERTLLEETIERNRAIADSISISTGKHLEATIQRKLPDASLIVEPERRDTGPAVGLIASQFDDDDYLLLVHSDAYIHPPEEYEKTMRRALELVIRRDMKSAMKAASTEIHSTTVSQYPTSRPSCHNGCRP